MRSTFTFRSLPLRPSRPETSAMPPPPEPQWPPRSPHEAALNTPAGRDRFRRIAERSSPSPSPSRRSRNPLTMSRSELLEPVELRMDIDGPSDEEVADEDEEMLQLQLAEIQARLKLKRLQAARGRKDKDGGTPRPGTGRSDFSAVSRSFDSAMLSPHVRRSTSAVDEEERPSRRPTSTAFEGNDIEVPASPLKKKQSQPDLSSTAQQSSPARVLLGIDKGLKAKDVSLGRAPSVVRKDSDPQLGGGYLRRTRTPNPGSTTTSTANLVSADTPRPLSFNERLAKARVEEMAKNEARVRAQAAKTDAFGISGQDMERFKQDAVEIPAEPPKARQFSRAEVLADDAGGAVGRIRRSNTVPSMPSGAQLMLDDDDDQDKDAASFEAYSSIHLSRRIIPHHVLVRQFSGKKVMVIEDLLRQVKAPDFSLPDTEQDIVLLGIVAKKSDPRAHKPTANRKDEQRGKYMVLTLVDLQHEVELFLFNSGFDRYWTLAEGTLVAILNPGVMPPPPGRLHSGRFSLTINSDADTIIEVGSARDLGFCKSVKRDASVCGAWVNRRRTEFCEYHTNEAVRRTASSRLELNTPGFGGKTAAATTADPRRRFRGDSSNNNKLSSSQDSGGTYDRDSKTHWFATRTLSASELIDGADRAMDRKDREELIKRRLAAKEREQEMMRKLGQVGAGAGKDYMRRAGGENQREVRLGSSTSSASGAPSTSASTSTAATASTSATSASGNSVTFTPSSSFSFGLKDQPPRLDARSLGLIPPRSAAADVKLGPIHKRKRLDSSGGLSSSPSGDPGVSNTTPSRPSTQVYPSPRTRTPGPTSGLGWGGALRDKLSRMRDGESIHSRRPGALSRPSTNSSNSPIKTATSSHEARMAMLGARRGSTDAPARKKTRFVTDQGIKEAGRESMGRDMGFDLDDDDELIIT